MTLLSWDSKQKSYNISKGMSRNSEKVARVANPAGVREDSSSYILPDGVNNGVAMKKKWFNEEGMLDLRLATGEEASAYLRGLGVKIAPVIRM